MNASVVLKNPFSGTTQVLERLGVSLFEGGMIVI